MRNSKYLLVILLSFCFLEASAQIKKNDEKIVIEDFFYFGLDEHVEILEKLKQANPFNRYFMVFSSKNPLIGQEFSLANPNSVAYISRLNYEQREVLYKKFQGNDNRWRSFKNSLKFTQPDAKSDAETLRQIFHDRHMYVYINEYDVTRKVDRKEDVVPIPMNMADVQPVPLGGFENFKRAVTLKTNWIEGLRHEDLPSFIKFKCTIYGGNRIEGLNLITEIEGSDEVQDRAYQFIGQIRKNILDFSRSHYPWKPGSKDGERVPVDIEISIPKSYF